MEINVQKHFYFSDNSYFDTSSNTIIDTACGKVIRYTSVSTTEGAVLKKLIQMYPNSVSKELLCTVINASCGNEEVRRIICDLKKKHEQLKMWIPRARDGKYQLREPIVSVEQKSVVNNPSRNHSFVLKNTGICTRPNFVKIARQDTFSQLDKAFQENHVVFLQGIGGIGKSEVAKHWALQKKKAGLFDTVVFAQLNSEVNNSNVQSLITDDTLFVISGDFHSRDEEESIESYFYRKLAMIKQITDERTLLIIDNYDIDDPQLTALFTGPYRLLVTTRNRQTGYDFPLIPVSEIQEVTYLKEIFFSNLEGERNDINWDDSYIEKLFALVSNHTLAIEIIAKALVNTLDTPENLYKKINVPTQRTLISNVEGWVERNFSEKPLSPFECIRCLFNLSCLKQDDDFEYKSQVLAFISAMPTRGIELSKFKKWSNNRVIRAKNSLVRKSWLRQDTVKGITLISMHPLIREIVWCELEPSLDKCSTIITNFSQDNSFYLDFLYHQPKNIKDIYERIAFSLLSAFPIQDLRWYDFYIKLQKIFHACANFTTALSIAQKLSCILEQKKQTDTWQYGFIKYKIGSAYSFIFRDRDKGVPYYNIAQKIMESTAHTNNEKMWLSFFYREIASQDCKDEYLFKANNTMYINTIIQRLNKGEQLVLELQKNGFNNTSLDIYYGTLCVWRSRIAVCYNNLDLATTLINTAESEFIRYGYPNTLDKAAIADVRALIYSAKGDYNQEIIYIQEATRVFEDGFGKYHRASIERAIKLAKAYQKNDQSEEAIKVLEHYQKIAKEMLGDDALQTVKIKKQLEHLYQYRQL